jgi:hypothetical protein
LRWNGLISFSSLLLGDLFLRKVSAYYASSSCTDYSMPACQMSSNSTSRGALQASSRVCGATGQTNPESDKCEELLHDVLSDLSVG